MMHRSVFLLIFCLVLAGCIETNHIEELAIINASGTDLVNSQIEETFIFFEFEDKKSEPKMVSGKGHTITGAAKDAALEVDFKMSPDKLGLKLYGLEVAEKGLKPFLDVLSRDPRLPNTMAFALSNTTAKDILITQEKSPIKVDVGQYLKEVIRKNSYGDQFPNITLSNLLLSIQDKGKDAILPVFSVGEKNLPKLTSIGLFNGDRYVGNLPFEDAILFNLTGRSKIKGTEFEMALPIGPVQEYIKNENKSGDHFDIAFEILKKKSKITITNADPLTFNTKLDLKLAIEETIAEVPLANPKVIELTEKQVEKQFETRFKKLIEQLQELKVDPIGYGERYRIFSKNRRFESDVWKDIYPNANFTFTISANIVDYGEHK